MFRFFPCVLAAGALTSPVLAGAAPPEPYPDLSGPKAAAFSFALALERGDAKTVKAIYAGEEMTDVSALADAMAKERAIAKRFAEVVTKRFGQNAAGLAMMDAPTPIRMGEKSESPQYPITLFIAQAKVVSKGDEAALTLAGRPVLLKKIGKDWRVINFPITAGVLPIIQGYASALEKVTNEVERGKYHKAYEIYPDLIAAIRAGVLKELKLRAGNVNEKDSGLVTLKAVEATYPGLIEQMTTIAKRGIVVRPSDSGPNEKAVSPGEILEAKVGRDHSYMLLGQKSMNWKDKWVPSEKAPKVGRPIIKRFQVRLANGRRLTVASYEALVIDKNGKEERLVINFDWQALEKRLRDRDKNKDTKDGR